LDNQLLKK